MDRCFSRIVEFAFKSADRPNLAFLLGGDRVAPGFTLPVSSQMKIPSDLVALDPQEFPHGIPNASHPGIPWRTFLWVPR